MHVEAEMLEYKPNACKVKAIAKIDGATAAEAELLFGLMGEGESK